MWQYWYLNTMLETVKLPAGISDLDTGLTNVDWDALSHFLRENGRKSLRIGEKTKKKRRKGVYQDAFWFYSLRCLISVRCYKFIATLNHSWLRDGQGGRCGRAVRTLLVVPNHLFNHGLNFLFNFKILPPDPPYEVLGFFYLFFIHQFEKNT